MKTIKLIELKTISGEDITSPKGKVETVREFVDLFLFQIPFQSLKLEDSVKAQNYFNQTAGQNGNGILSVEDAEYAWVEVMITKYSHLVAGLNAVKIKEAWANLEE